MNTWDLKNCRSLNLITFAKSLELWNKQLLKWVYTADKNNLENTFVQEPPPETFWFLSRSRDIQELTFVF